MLIDTSLILSQEQAVLSSTASTHIIDQGAAGNAHTHAALYVQVDESFAGATAVKIALETADVANNAPKNRK